MQPLQKIMEKVEDPEQRFLWWRFSIHTEWSQVLATAKVQKNISFEFNKFYCNIDTILLAANVLICVA